MSIILELQGIYKTYGSTIANHDINLKVEKGEIRALLGENGAGKSTLVKIIYGVTASDSGKIYWKGELLKRDHFDLSKELGIQMVFQHFSLLESFTVAENIALSLKTTAKKLHQQITQTSQKYGFDLNLEEKVLNLSVSEKQRVEIVRVLIQNPQLLILDEPTSVLNPIEIERFFKFLKKLSQEGCSILYISHKLDEIKALCHSATILRKGKVIMHCDPTKETKTTLAEKMMGQRLGDLERKKITNKFQKQDNFFEVNNLSLTTQGQNISISKINFTIKPKEILAIAGVAGNGQKLLQEALFGLVSCQAEGQILFQGKDIGKLSLKQRRQRQMAFVSEERLGISAVPEMDLVQNNFLTSYMHKRDYLQNCLINYKKINVDSSKIIKDFEVVAPSTKTEARSLSGGNLQKFIVGREIFTTPKLLIIVNPTWGVDAGAKKNIHQVLLDLAASGTAILLISQDLDEIYEISDRIAVLFKGRLSLIYDTKELDNQKIGLLMGGEVLTNQQTPNKNV